MKIKGSVDKISNKLILLLSLTLICISVPVRIILVSSSIDPETGFYTGNSIFVSILNLLTALFFLITVFAFISKESNEINHLGWKNKQLGILTAIFSVSLLYDCFYSIAVCGSSLTAVSSSSVSAFKAMMTSGTIPSFFRFIFAMLSAVYFLKVAKGFIKGNSKYEKNKMLALSPIAWAGFRMISLFIKQISFINVSDLFLELVLLSCMILFFMAFAQVSSGIYSETSAWRLIGFGLVSAVMALMLNIPKVIFSFVDSGAKINAEYPLSVTDFVFALFIIGFVNFAVRNKEQ